MNSVHKPHPRPRWGKTEKDRSSGAKERRDHNLALRVEWEHDPKSTRFPKVACNGKKNRHRWTGKGGNTVVKA